MSNFVPLVTMSTPRTGHRRAWARHEDMEASLRRHEARLSGNLLLPDCVGERTLKRPPHRRCIASPLSGPEEEYDR